MVHYNRTIPESIERFSVDLILIFEITDWLPFRRITEQR